MKLKIFTVFAIAVFMVSVMAIGSAEAATQITAQQAYDWVVDGTPPTVGLPTEAILIDVRTLEECYWVGSPADEYGNQIAYNFPYKLWTHRIDRETGKPILRTVKRLFGVFIRRTFSDKDTPLILMCRSGKRADEAAEYLETTLGYTYIYEINNPLKSGRGGFQGSGSNCKCSTVDVVGYRGYPERLGLNEGSTPCASYCYYETDSTNIEEDECEKDEKLYYRDENVSVSWMDTGLPITQTLNCDLIWPYMLRK